MKTRELPGSWKVWAGVALAVIAAIWVAGMLWSRAGDPDRILAEPRGADGRLTKDQVRRLLQCRIRDVDSNTRDYKYFSPLTTSPNYHGGFDWAINMLCANRRTDAKVAHEGRVISGWLIEIALDSVEGNKMRCAACMTLLSVDPHGALEAFKEHCKSARPTALERHWFSQGLPWARRVNGKTPAPYTHQAFAADIAAKTVDDIYLERLDEAISDDGLASNSAIVLNLLNRYHGEDFDGWLSANAPEVLAFRKRESERGYNAVSNAWLMRDVGPGKESVIVADERLVRGLYKDEADRAAVRRLLQICADGTLRNGEENWRETLMQWYNANRSRLVYDPKVMYFVVGDAQTSVNVDSTGSAAKGHGLDLEACGLSKGMK
jgi:hypothetical protein